MAKKRPLIKYRHCLPSGLNLKSGYSQASKDITEEITYSRNYVSIGSSIVNLLNNYPDNTIYIDTCKY